MTYKQAIKAIDTDMEGLAIYALRYGKIINTQDIIQEGLNSEMYYFRVRTIELDNFTVETTHERGNLWEIEIINK